MTLPPESASSTQSKPRAGPCTPLLIRRSRSAQALPTSITHFSNSSPSKYPCLCARLKLPAITQVTTIAAQPTAAFTTHRIRSTASILCVVNHGLKFGDSMKRRYSVCHCTCAKFLEWATTASACVDGRGGPSHEAHAAPRHHCGIPTPSSASSRSSESSTQTCQIKTLWFLKNTYTSCKAPRGPLNPPPPPGRKPLAGTKPTETPRPLERGTS